MKHLFKLTIIIVFIFTEFSLAQNQLNIDYLSELESEIEKKYNTGNYYINEIRQKKNQAGIGV